MIHTRNSDHISSSPEIYTIIFLLAHGEQHFGCVTNGGHLGNGGHIEFCKCQLNLHNSQLNAVSRKTVGLQQNIRKLLKGRPS